MATSSSGVKNLKKKVLINARITLSQESWAENFKTVDIEINASSLLFINLKINLIFILYPEKCIKFNQLE